MAIYLRTLRTEVAQDPLNEVPSLLPGVCKKRRNCVAQVNPDFHAERAEHRDGCFDTLIYRAERAENGEFCAASFAASGDGAVKHRV